MAERDWHVDAPGVFGEAPHEALEDAAEAPGNSWLLGHDVSYYNIRPRWSREMLGAANHVRIAHDSCNVCYENIALYQSALTLTGMRAGLVGRPRAKPVSYTSRPHC